MLLDMAAKSNGVCSVKKLRLDFTRWTRLRARMDTDSRELIDRLGCEIGCIFEDAAPIALTLKRVPDGGLGTVIGALERDIQDTIALVGAIRHLADGRRR